MKVPHPLLHYLTFIRTFSSPLVGFFLHFVTPSCHVLAMFSFSRMITSVSAALALASVSSVLAVPISTKAAPLVARATIPSPAFVVYTDRFVSAEVLPPASELAVRFICSHHRSCDTV